MFELPPASASGNYNTAWKHALTASELGGPYGLRTAEPTYQRYMSQYRFDAATGLRECQWNGPSWPFQSSQVLTGMANLLDDYPEAGVTADDYLRLLRQYTHQHFVEPGKADLQEDYDPDTGKPIVGLPRSHHYSHSTYVDLVISGLVGLRPRADDMLEVRPLVPLGGPKPIRFFALENVRYHGHEVGVIWDAEGSRYGIGAGLSVFVDGQRAAGPVQPGRVLVPLRAVSLKIADKVPVDLAVNIGVPDGPKGSASSTATPEGIAQAIDGRMWFFPEEVNGWSPAADDAESWYAVDFGKQRILGSLELYFFEDGQRFGPPASYRVQTRTAMGWSDVEGQRRTPEEPLAGGENRIVFPARSTTGVRVIFAKPSKAEQFRLIELKAFEPK